ncbi:MAG: hypothetical protein C0404_05250 [Verrucomicrobia bacterium]|nr:hypothetical protein [Verrucomicrobiota bacterium]
MNVRIHYLVCGIAITLCAGILGADDKPVTSISGLKLRNALWQALPDSVCGVYVGPDQRIWYELDSTGTENPELVRRIIRDEFTKPAPQLFGARPVLFEPGGRVWFVTKVERTLIGFDGKDMVERQVEFPRLFKGDCPNHGRRIGREHNQFLESTSFFVESFGVLTFSGGNWAYQQLAATNTTGFTDTPPVLYPEPDGKGLIAFAREVNNARIWSWRTNAWTEIHLPASISRTNLTAALPFRNGLLLCFKKDIQYLPYAMDVPGEFERLLKQLGADKYRTREDATEALIKMGLPVLAPSEAALKNSDDPEVRDRLQRVIRQLKPDKTGLSTLGRYRIKDPRLGLYETGGTIYLCASGIESNGVELGSGILVAAPGKEIAALTGPVFAGSWLSSSSEYSRPLVSEPGTLIWTPVISPKNTARFIEMTKGLVIQTMPDPAVGWLHAVTKDGTVFAARRDPSQPGSGPIMVCTPGAPEDRNLLKAICVEINRDDSYGIDSEGRIWVDVPAKGVQQFDGTKWTPVVALEDRTSPSMYVPGDNGAMIVRFNDSQWLLKNGKAVQCPTLQELILRHRDVIGPAFSNGCNLGWLSIATDKGGNIWLRDERRLHVLIGDTWVEASGPLTKAGSRIGEVEYLGLCGDGSRVYLTDFMMAHSQGRSFFGEVSKGALAFTNAPHTCARNEMFMEVRDSAGLWVPGDVRGSGGTSDSVEGQLAIRINEKGVDTVLTNAGWAMMCDMSENVWLGSMRGKPYGNFNIFRGGSIVSSINIPGGEDNMSLIQDRTGSVYARTKLGIQHIVAPNPDKPSEYVLDKLYSVEGIKGIEDPGMGYSALGFFLITSHTDVPGNRKYYLNLIPIPAPQADTTERPVQPIQKD